MKIEELLAAMQKKFDDSQEGRILAEKSIEAKIKALGEKYEKFEASTDGEEIAALKKSIADLEDEISDVRTKAANTFAPTGDEKEAVRSVVRAAFGGLFKSKSAQGSKEDLMQGLGKALGAQLKTLNLGSDADGALAIAEVLRRDVIEYAREFSPIMSLIGRDPVMTRDYRVMVLQGYPSVAAGVENIAGSVLPLTDTQKYSQIRGKTWKVYSKPQITDEAMVAPDVDLYSHLIQLLAEQMGIYQAAQVLQGSGVDDANGTNARGILSSNRVDITDGTGESFKPTLAADPADARDPDFYPVAATGVAGALGSDDEAIVNFFIDLINSHPTRFLGTSGFCMNRLTKGIVEKVRDADNNPIFIGNYMNGGKPAILGYPVTIDDTMPNVAVDSTPIIFGDLSKAYYVNDGDIDKMLLDPYSVDQCTVVKTSKEMFERVGNTDAIQIVACTTNSGS